MSVWSSLLGVPWQSAADPLAGPLGEQRVELCCALGEQTLDRNVEDAGEQERVVERRDLLAGLPARHLSAGSVTEEARDVLLRELALRAVAPEAIGRSSFAD
jgi:hypothetical protein